ncbi:MAG: hypothetical protein Q8Q00_10280 [Dehalococcoidia bacterium]|nr:hypothetical protein [Dehalococcoidia bacterium]
MFDAWRRPDDKMPRKKGGVTAIAFDSLVDILSKEMYSVLGVAVFGEPRFNHLLMGLQLARELALSRSEIGYAGYQPVVLTVLFFKTLNDLLSASLSIRAGYALQAYPCLRAALETSELMEHLKDHPENVEHYVRGAEDFARDTSWIRKELPDSKTRIKVYDFLNYQTHANFKGLNIYTTYDVDGSTTAAEVGPTPLRSPAMTAPYLFLVIIAAYAIRTMWRLDESAVSKSWLERFQAFDQSAEHFLAEVPPPPGSRTAED